MEQWFSNFSERDTLTSNFATHLSEITPRHSFAEHSFSTTGVEDVSNEKKSWKKSKLLKIEYRISIIETSS